VEKLKKIITIFLIIVIFVSLTYSQENKRDVAYVGVRIRDSKAQDGAVITSIIENTPASNSNLKVGDKIISFEGRKILNASDFLLNLYSFRPGNVIEIGYIRDSIKKTEKIKLVKKEDKYSYIYKKLPYVLFWFRMKEMGNFLQEKGFAVENMNGQLFDYFNVDSGVVVVFIEKDTVAEEIGLKTGDVITRINDRNIKHTVDFRNYYEKHDTLQLHIKRRDSNLKIKLVK